MTTTTFVPQSSSAAFQLSFLFINRLISGFVFVEIILKIKMNIIGMGLRNKKKMLK